jgi:hypothetical protein
MAQFFLEAFQWHGVKRGDAFAFYAGDIRVEALRGSDRAACGEHEGVGLDEPGARRPNG